ncbi:MAG TPA: response regulator [Streptosporangiaceae bacterium]|nr:response regulator [Streptosporangiaceae bacterium]
MPVRCIIVDDNRDFLRAASTLLDRDEITVVGVASTGAQAHRACGELRPDLVLLDIQLGEESGFEVARQLSGRPGLGTPRVILISSYSREDFGDMIADTPAISFLPKEALSATAVLAMLARPADPVSGY